MYFVDYNTTPTYNNDFMVSPFYFCNSGGTIYYRLRTYCSRATSRGVRGCLLCGSATPYEIAAMFGPPEITQTFIFTVCRHCERNFVNFFLAPSIYVDALGKFVTLRPFVAAEIQELSRGELEQRIMDYAMAALSLVELSEPQIDNVVNLPAGATYNGGPIGSSSIFNVLVDDQVPSAIVGTDSISIGGNASTLAATDAIALGSTAVATGVDSIAVGHLSVTAAADAVTIGHLSQAGAASAVSMGLSANASGINSVALGPTSVASGASTVALGVATDATATGAVAVGNTAQATSTNTVAVGSTATASNTNSVAVGQASIASGSSGVALGSVARAQGQNSISIGTSSTAFDSRSVAIGTSTFPRGFDGISIGNLATAAIGTTTGAISMGSGASAHDDAVAIGTAASVTAANGVVVGANSSAGSYGVSLGHTASAQSDRAISIGKSSFARGTDSIAIGNLATNNALTTVNAISIGNQATAYDEAIAIGTTATTSEPNGIAIGRATLAAANCVALGDGASAEFSGIAIGNASVTSAANPGGIAVGSVSSANGNSSIAMGISASANFNDCVVIGGNAVSGAQRSVCVGEFAVSTLADSITIGRSANNDGAASTLISYNGNIELNSSGVVIGKTHQLTGSATNSVIVAHQPLASTRSNCVSLGNGTVATSPLIRFEQAGLTKVTQGTSLTTTVDIPSGSANFIVEMFSTIGATTSITFTLTNQCISTSSFVMMNVVDGVAATSGAPVAFGCGNLAAGSMDVYVRNNSAAGATTLAPIIHFWVMNPANL